MRPLVGHQDLVLCVAFSADGRWLASGGADNRLFLWDLLHAEAVEVDYQPAGWVACVAFSPDGRWLAVGEHHGRLTLIECATRQAAFSRDVSRAAISGLAFTPDGLHLAWCDYAGVVGLWPLDQPPEPLMNEAREQFALTISPRGQHLAAAGRNNRVLVWSLPVSEPPRSFAFSDEEGCRCLVFDPDERTLIAALGDSLVAWDLRDGRHRWCLEHPAVASGVGLSPDGRLLASGAWDGKIRLFERDPDDTVSPRPLRELDFGQPRIFDLALSHDGMVGAVAGSLPDPLILWDVD